MALSPLNGVLEWRERARGRAERGEALGRRAREAGEAATAVGASGEDEVRAEVDANGKLLALDFDPEFYEHCDPDALSDAILAAVKQVKAQAGYVARAAAAAVYLEREEERHE